MKSKSVIFLILSLCSHEGLMSDRFLSDWELNPWHVIVDLNYLGRIFSIASLPETSFSDLKK